MLNRATNGRAVWQIAGTAMMADRERWADPSLAPDNKIAYNRGILEEKSEAPPSTGRARLPPAPPGQIQ